MKQKLLRWYEHHGRRQLPWRKNTDPYRVWISEIMLQQTRVEAAKPFYERFLRRFPTVTTLAGASQDDVLAHWAGLGYYSRAKNLHKAAKQIVALRKFPDTPEALRELPGIGVYTSNAIASIAFGHNVPSIDGNLERVISRLLDLREDPKKEGRAAIEEFAYALTKKGRAGDINQAFMDLSSLICLPKNPRCMLCPLRKNCRAHRAGSTDLVPLRKRATRSLELESQGYVVIHEDKLLLARRKQGEWLSGLWDIPWQVAPFPVWWKQGKSWKLIDSHTLVRHITKYKIQFSVRFYRTSRAELPQELKNAGSEWLWHPIADLENINLPRPSRQALTKLLAKTQ